MTYSIFAPRFNQKSRRILAAIDQIERERWLFENMLLMPKHHAWMRREVSIRRAAGTTSIENVGMEEKAVGRLLRRGGTGKPDEAEQANLNALRAYELIDYLSNESAFPIDELVIRHLNREFIYDAPDALTPGVYRKGQNEVPGFLTPNQGDVPDLMRAFSMWLRDETAINPVLKAGIAHIHLVAIHPFWDGNGRTARGLTTLVLQRKGVGFNKLLSLESGFASIRDHYFTAIERTLGSQLASGYDATPWLEFFADCLLAEAKRLTGTLTDWHRMMEEFAKENENLGLNFRQTEALAYAIHTGLITRGDYMEITSSSPVTASRDLADLVQMGLLTAEGRTRNRVYRFEAPQVDTSPDQEVEEKTAQQKLPL